MPTPVKPTADSRLPAGGPRQKRSRERYEHLLGVAETMLLEAGGEAFRMSDLVARSGVPFGSLYQYFPDRSAVIGALAERYNRIGRDCVAGLLAPVCDMGGLLKAVDGIVDGFYRMFRDYPVMKPIWAATQADPQLQAIDREDVDVHATLLRDAYRRVVPRASMQRSDTLCRLVTELMACAVRHALTLDDADARRSLTMFKRGISGFFIDA